MGAVAETTGGNCAKLLESYLGQGLFDGLSGATNSKMMYCKEGGACKGDFAVQKAELESDMTNGKDKWVPAQEYTLTFWLKLSDAMAVDSNILHYGDAEFKRSPAVYVKAGTTNLKVSISQDNEQDFHCSVDGEEEPGAPHEVHELGDPGRNDASAAEMIAGQATGTQTLNMPGPAYGKPGYKESHNWESDVDVYSPIVFNQKYYAAKYVLADKNEAELKADWKDAGLAADLTAPDCRQGTADFSLNAYAEKNPAVAETTGGNCAKLLESYLGQGLFDGLSGATNSKMMYCKEGEKAACTNPDGQTVTQPEGTHLYLSDPWTEAARAELQGLPCYPKYQMAEAEIVAQSEIERGTLK